MNTILTSDSKRQLRILIEGVLQEKLSPMPDGLEFYVTDKVAEYIKAVYEKQEPPQDVRERILGAMQRGANRAARLDYIEGQIRTTLHINPSTKEWSDFIEFAYDRDKKGQDIKIFLTWLCKKKDFDISYWPPKKLQVFWDVPFAKPASTPNVQPIEVLS
jgi:hypothetical protein